MLQKDFEDLRLHLWTQTESKKYRLSIEKISNFYEKELLKTGVLLAGRIFADCSHLRNKIW